MKDLLAQRQRESGLQIWEIAKEVAKLRGTGNADKYYGAIKKALAQPDQAEWRTLRDIWSALGVDAEAAIADAAKVTHPVR